MSYTFLLGLTFAICMQVADAKADPNQPSATVTAVASPNEPSVVFKIGYVDHDYIMEHLPEAKKNNADIQSFEKQLQNQIQAKAKELQEQSEAAQQQLDTLTEAQKKQKYAEFNKLQMVIQELQEAYPVKMEQKVKEVMQPLYNRIQEAVNQVATEHGYTFVLNKNIGTLPVVCFAPQTFDLSSLVVTKLKAMAPEAVKAPVIGPQNNPTTKEPAKRSSKKATKSSVKTKK